MAALGHSGKSRYGGMARRLTQGGLLPAQPLRNDLVMSCPPTNYVALCVLDIPRCKRSGLSRMGCSSRRSMGKGSFPCNPVRLLTARHVGAVGVAFGKGAAFSQAASLDVSEYGRKVQWFHFFARAS